jgi:hypothetical protein
LEPHPSKQSQNFALTTERAMDPSFTHMFKNSVQHTPIRTNEHIYTHRNTQKSD